MRSQPIMKRQGLHLARASGPIALGTLVALGAGCGGGPAAKAVISKAVRPVAGSVDSHCQLADGTTKIQKTDLAACQPDGLSSTDQTGHGDGAYRDPNYNAEAADDDCKYLARMTIDPALESAGAYFGLQLSRLADGQAAQGARIAVEAYLNEIHPARTVGIRGLESPPGTYTLGPIPFDVAGRWTIRFHLFEDCAGESASSPHSHVAFYLGAS